MFTPTNSLNIKESKMPAIRIGIQGEPGTGKTYGALTFPNPIVLDFDGGLQAYYGRDVLTIPFHDNEWIMTYENGKYKPNKRNPETGRLGLPNRRDALIHWLETDGFKLEREQTLILDSWSTVQDAEDAQQAVEPKLTKEGKFDDFHPWMQKTKYAKDLAAHLASLRCNVVVLFHEFKDRDDKGRILDKTQPLMQGKYVCELKKSYPFFFRSVCTYTPAKGADGKEVKTEPKYWWQIRSNSYFDAKCARIDLVPKELDRVENNYNFFQQYIYATQ